MQSIKNTNISTITRLAFALVVLASFLTIALSSTYVSASSHTQGSPTDSRRGEDCTEENKPNPNEDALHPDNCGIIRYVFIIADGLAVLVGIVVVMMLIVGGIQYSAAGSNPQAVVAAKKHIGQALLALVIYIFLYAFMQWLIPGGVFS